MSTLNEIPCGGEPGADANPEPIRDGVYLGSADHDVTDTNVMAVGENAESDADEHPGPLTAGWVLAPGID